MNRGLSKEELDNLLDETRNEINKLSKNDPDKQFYINRFIFARLQLDERKTKTQIKKELFLEETICFYKKCARKEFDTRKGVHLHRRNGDKGYSLENCVLMHPECHQKFHQENPKKRKAKNNANKTFLSKQSKRYHNDSFDYWWDITPELAESLPPHTIIEFIKKDTQEKDTHESCFFPFQILKPYLTEERQTSRGAGNWGIKVLPDKPNELAIEESGKKPNKWKSIPVKWESREEI